LPLEQAVEALQLLLLAQPHAVLAELAAAEAVHAGRRVAPLDGALGAVATAALEVELHALPPAQLAHRIDRASHGRCQSVVGSALLPSPPSRGRGEEECLTRAVSWAAGSRCAAAACRPRWP